MVIPLSQEVFGRLRDLIYRQVGLSFPDSKKYLLENRLQGRLASLHCHSFEEYFHFLEFDPGAKYEWVELKNCVTTNETFFFRDQMQIDCLKGSIFPKLLKAREAGKCLRIWSAGCSSGEEAYTMSLILQEQFPSLSDWKVEIIGTDISEQVLAMARRGTYGPYAVRNVPPEWLKKHFTMADGQYSIKTGLRRWVRFSNLNLFNDTHMQTIKDVDLVLCRNVLIYFDETGRKKIINGFYNALRDEGLLMIGFSESLHNIARSFRPQPWNKTVVYHKVGTRFDGGISSRSAVFSPSLVGEGRLSQAGSGAVRPSSGFGRSHSISGVMERKTSTL